MKQNKKTMIILSCVLVVLVAAFALIYIMNRPETNVGDKTITLEVVFEDGTSKEHTISTDAEFLLGALEEKELVSVEDGMITAVEGVSRNLAEQKWWKLTKDGVTSTVGAGEIAIVDGDHYELTLTVGYDF